jgi:hypothetical protein
MKQERLKICEITFKELLGMVDDKQRVIIAILLGNSPKIAGDPYRDRCMGGIGSDNGGIK